MILEPERLCRGPDGLPIYSLFQLGFHLHLWEVCLFSCVMVCWTGSGQCVSLWCRKTAHIIHRPVTRCEDENTREFKGVLRILEKSSHHSFCL